MLERAFSACPHDCPSTCALEIEMIDEHTIGRVYGAKDNTYTDGVICAKVGRYAERLHHPDRLSAPLRRIGNKGAGLGAFVPITWDDALDEVAENLTQATLRHGSETVWPHFYAGTMGLVQRDGIERLRHVMSYSRQHGTICSTVVDAGWLAGTGMKRGVDPREMTQSDLIVVWGGNPLNTQVNVMHWISRARKERGTKLVVIDPYRTGTAEKADLHLMVRPGTDGALACAVMHVLFKENYADQAYLQAYTDVPDELEAHLATKTPQWAEEITGVASEDIIRFARLYGETQRSFIRIGYGFSRSRNGAANVHAVSCLPAITGAWQHPGGGALYTNHGMYGIEPTLIQGLDARDKSIRVLDQSRIGPILCGSQRDLGDGPPVTALFIQNTNPMMVSPASNEVRAGFERSDLFVCVHEQFMTETAAMADVVLPATMFLEHDDLYQSGGHTHLYATRKVVEPYAECRSNHWVICELAKRLGAEHPGFAMSAWEIMDETLKRSGYPGAAEIHAARWHDCGVDFRTGHFLDGFGTDDKRFHFKPDWSRVGPDHEVMPPLPDFMATIDTTNAEHPFRLVTAPARNYLNSSFTETPSSKKSEKRPTVFVNPQDCDDLGVQQAGRVRIGNTQGSVVVHAKPFDGVQQGVLVVESIWPNHAFEEGVGINCLISPDPAPPNGGAVFHDTAVWLRCV
jgi:anaerobic selenocysteine-containing dehydrogenase